MRVAAPPCTGSGACKPLARESGRGRDPLRSNGRVRVAAREHAAGTLTFPPLRGGPLPCMGLFSSRGIGVSGSGVVEGLLLSIRVELACWGASCSRRSLVFGGSENPCHDATLRIGGEAPRWRSILSRGKRSQGRVRATPPRIRSAGCLGPAEAGSALLTRRRDEARRLPAPHRR